LIFAKYLLALKENSLAVGSSLIFFDTSKFCFPPVLTCGLIGPYILPPAAYLNLCAPSDYWNGIREKRMIDLPKRASFPGKTKKGRIYRIKKT